MNVLKYILLFFLIAASYQIPHCSGTQKYCRKCIDGYNLTKYNTYRTYCIENSKYENITQTKPNCIQLDSTYTNCTVCERGYILNETKDCIYAPHCDQLNADNKCTACEKNFAINEAFECVEKAYCKQIKENKCKECDDYYYPNEKGNCKEIPIEHCKKGNSNICNECATNYYLNNDNTKCLPVPAHCKTFNYPEKKCVECELTYYLNNDNLCIEIPIEHCLRGNAEECEKCDDHYILSQDKKKCTYSNSNLNLYMFLENDEETETTIPHCLDRDSSGCTRCEYYYYINKNKTCSRKPDNCYNFSDSEMTCIECRSSYYLKDEICEEIPIVNCIEGNDTICERCSGDTILSPDGTKCSTPCEELETFCSQCESYYYSFDYGLSCKELETDLEPEQINMTIYSYNNNYRLIGNNKLIFFVTDYSDKKGRFNSDDIQENTKFTGIIYYDEEENDDEQYNGNCYLFKQASNNISVICTLDKNLKKYRQYIKLDKAEINYKGNSITLYTNSSVLVYQLDYHIPFIYSDNENIINMKDATDKYIFKYNYISYDESDKLYLRNTDKYYYTFIDKCITTTTPKELSCEISKEKLGSVLINEDSDFKLGFINSGLFTFNFVPDSYVIYDISQKENIHVTITKLLNDKTQVGSTFTYETETNIDDISDINSKYLFKMRFKNCSDNDYITSINCYFRKDNNNTNKNLLLVCVPDKEGIVYFGESDEYSYQYTYKYNFIIHPITNYAKVTIKGSCASINLLTTKEVDLSLQPSVTIGYIMDSFNEPLNKIKLNTDSNNFLECSDSFGMKNCIVGISHFIGKEKTDDYYYTNHYIDGLKGYATHYEINTIRVKLPNSIIHFDIENNDNIKSLVIGSNGYLYFHTNYINNQNKLNKALFDQNNFEGRFIANDTETYISNCKLLELTDKSIGIICKLNEVMNFGNNNISIRPMSLLYKEQNKENLGVAISYKGDNINIKQLNYEMSFLYSDKQEINIVDNQDTYNLKFKKYSYDNRPLYLYTSDIKSTKLDCVSANDELTCSVKKDKLIEILSRTGEVFSVGEIVDNVGLYKFNSVLDIKVIYAVQKENLQITIKNLLTKVVSKNEFIAYETETNTDNTKTFTSDYFGVAGQTNDDKGMNCLFKKNSNQNKILLLCDAPGEGKSKLGTIKSFSYDNINVLYNIEIKESENIDEFNVLNTEGTKIFSVNPLELNFNNKDEYIIKYEAEYPDNLRGIKLNNESNFELECVTKDGYKECKVNATHFSSKGNYYTYHLVDQNTYAISYELPMINVILKEEEKTDETTDKPTDENPDDGDSNVGLIVGLTIAGVVVLAVAIFLVWHFLKKKNVDNNLESGNNKLVDSTKE